MIRDYLSGERKLSAATASSPVPKKGEPIEKAILIEDHWRRMGHKVQHDVVVEAFRCLFVEYPHLRPIWVFGRQDTEEDFREDPNFKLHVERVSETLTKLVEHLQEPKWFRHLLEETGLRHFFYDAAEPHFPLIQECFMASLKSQCGPDSRARLTEELELAWAGVLHNITQTMADGVAESRKRYLTLTILEEDMELIRRSWAKVRQHGLNAAGLHLCQGALRAYQALLKQYGQESIGAVDTSAPEFDCQLRAFAEDTVAALDLSIEAFHPDTGFQGLPELLQDYVRNYLYEGVSPSVVRKAMMEGFINMLTYVLGEVWMTEEAQRTWLKLYRVMEQAIITNLVQL